jgi:hypothetical protein
MSGSGIVRAMAVLVNARALAVGVPDQEAGVGEVN